MSAYFDALDHKMPCNMALLAGHCTARAAAGGNENRPLTATEEKKMLGILEKALQQGAAGLSLGLMYKPGLYADVEELKKVADAVEHNDEEAFSNYVEKIAREDLDYVKNGEVVFVNIAGD